MIYLVQNQVNKDIKIGKSNSLKKRLIDLQTGNSYKLNLIGMYLSCTYTEKELHKLFSSYYIRGEWFRYNKYIVDFIKTECVMHYQYSSYKDLRYFTNKDINIKIYTNFIEISNFTPHQLHKIRLPIFYSAI